MNCEGESGHIIKNWAETYTCKPKLFFEPKTKNDLRSILQRAKKSKLKVKVMGGRHSPSDIAFTDDYMVSLENFNRVLNVDKDNHRITVEAGVYIHQLNEEILPKFNMALSNQGSVAAQTVAGMIATGSHGTGIAFEAFSSDILGITFMTADGSVIQCSAEKEPQLFQAAKCHLGILGIILDVTIQCEPSFYLHEKQEATTLTNLLSSLDDYLNSSEHFLFKWFPHTDNVVTRSCSRSKRNPKSHQNWIRNTLVGYYLLEFFLWLAAFFPGLLPFINRAFFRFCYSYKQERIDVSHKVFNINCLFKQYVTEWAVPRCHTKAVMIEMRNWLDNHPHVKVHFPVEVRFVKRDNTMMTPSGDEDVTFIGIISYRPYGKEVDRKEWWNFFENLAIKYQGKPHWAKAHAASSTYLRKMYRRFDEFMELRKKLDPDQMFLNQYWTRILNN